ncbi:hypothetical protein MRX96_032630 [Rhipicephalus microplus]
MHADRACEAAVKRSIRTPRLSTVGDNSFGSEFTECPFGPSCRRLWLKNYLPRISSIRDEAKREVAIRVLKEAFPGAEDHAEF